MKKLLYTGFLIILSLIFLNGRSTNHISADVSTYSNRTVQELVKLSETDEGLFSRLENYSDDVPIIEYNGGFFANEYESKETYEVEIRSEDGKRVLFSDSNPATVGEVKKAILENQ
ncbi:TPA: hypothetical protein ACGO3A_000618 [Streptococcus suis]